jgi:hypothetical protein
MTYHECKKKYTRKDTITLKSSKHYQSFGKILQLCYPKLVYELAHVLQKYTNVYRNLFVSI